MFSHLHFLIIKWVRIGKEEGDGGGKGVRQFAVLKNFSGNTESIHLENWTLRTADLTRTRKCFGLQSLLKQINQFSCRKWWKTIISSEEKKIYIYKLLKPFNFQFFYGAKNYFIRFQNYHCPFKSQSVI